MNFEEFVRRSKGLSEMSAINTITAIRGELNTFTESELIEEAEKYQAASTSPIDITIARYYKVGK